MENEKVKCDECGLNLAMHWSSMGGIERNLCCTCHVRRGGAPADWHLDCIKEYERMKGKVK